MPNANAETPLSPALATRLFRTALLTLGVGAFALLLATAHVPCGFARIFHTPCPGCGSTRAMIALCHGDLAGLVRFNPLAPLMTALLVVLAGQAFVSMLTTGTMDRVSGQLGKVLARAAVVIAVLEFTLWVLRFTGFFGGPVPV